MAPVVIISKKREVIQRNNIGLKVSAKNVSRDYRCIKPLLSIDEDNVMAMLCKRNSKRKKAKFKKRKVVSIDGYHPFLFNILYHLQNIIKNEVAYVK